MSLVFFLKQKVHPRSINEVFHCFTKLSRFISSQISAQVIHISSKVLLSLTKLRRKPSAHCLRFSEPKETLSESNKHCLTRGISNNYHVTAAVHMATPLKQDQCNSEILEMLRFRGIRVKVSRHFPR